MKIRQAELAFRGGQLDQAGRLLQEGGLGEFLPGQKLQAKVAKQIVKRAKGLVSAGETSAGWRDLETAASLTGENPQIAEAREVLLARGITEVEKLIEADQPKAALARVEKLISRHGSTDQVRVLKRIAQRLIDAIAGCERGRFTDAEAHLSAAEALRPDMKRFAALRKECRLNKAECRRLSDALHRALSPVEDTVDWTEVLSLAESLLEIAPQHVPARSARERAWEVVGMRATRAGNRINPPARAATPNLVAPNAAEPNIVIQHISSNVTSEKEDAVTQREPGARMLLWIDAVGGFLVCLGDEIVLGPPTPEAGADVPILADLSRRHAVIRRDGEGYSIEPVQSVKVDGRLLSGTTTISDGQLIELGEGVEMRFRKPHALSASARLEMVSRHRTDPAVDAILLMAESCVMGPAWHNHLVCRDWSEDVVLFRQDDHLVCRSSQPLTVDGVEYEDSAPVSAGCRVEGEDFSLSIEALE